MLQNDEHLGRLRSGGRVVEHVTTVARTAGLDRAAAATAGMSRRELVDALLWMASVTVSASPRANMLQLDSLGPRWSAEEWQWSDDDLRRAHARHKAGERDPRVVEGELIYQRLRGRRRRRSATRQSTLAVAS